MFVGIRAEGPRDFSPGRAGTAGDALGQRRPKRPFRLKDGENVGVQRSRRPSGEKRGRRAAESRAPLAAPTPPEADRRALSGPSAGNARFCHGHVPAIRPETSASDRFHPGRVPRAGTAAEDFRNARRLTMGAMGRAFFPGTESRASITLFGTAVCLSQGSSVSLTSCFRYPSPVWASVSSCSRRPIRAGP